jgi:hypothetical protein
VLDESKRETVKIDARPRATKPWQPAEKKREKRDIILLASLNLSLAKS